MWVLLITLYHFTQSGRSYTVSPTYGGAYETKQLCLQAGGFLSQSASDSAPANNKRDPTDGISVSTICLPATRAAGDHAVPVAP